MGALHGQYYFEGTAVMKLRAVSLSDVNNQLPSEKDGLEHAVNNLELRITKITQQVKRPERYSIYVNEKYSFSLHEYQLAGSGLRTGMILTKDVLENFATESQFGKAYERTVRYVMLRPRSEKEVRDYLTRTFLYPKPKVFVDQSGQRHIKKQTVDKEKTNHMIQRIMTRLSEKGYINDEIFAKAWVASRQIHKKTSLKKLQQELMAKGVSQEILDSVLQDQDIDEITNIQELIVKKRRQAKYHDSTKLTQYLMRQGFRYSDIQTALRQESE